MVLGLLPSTRAINEISVGAMKQITSHESSVGETMKIQWVPWKIQWVRAAPLILRCIRSNVIIITVDRVGELKNLMFEQLWPLFRPYVYRLPRGNQMPRLIYYLVPVLSSVLFVITEAFHIFYSD